MKDQKRSMRWTSFSRSDTDQLKGGEGHNKGRRNVTIKGCHGVRMALHGTLASFGLFLGLAVHRGCELWRGHIRDSLPLL